KLTEIFKALNLEKEYSKDQILEAYLNLINLGGGAYGVQSAARTYFDKDVQDLTLMECAAIAGITQNPSSYNPIYYPNNNTKRRNDVLYNMYDQGYISKEDYLICRFSKLELNPGDSATSATAVVDWYTDMIREDVVEDLIAAGYSSEAAKSMLYQGGLKIYSAVDQKLQSICEKHYITNAKSLISSLPTLQSGIFCVDYEGRILATVGRRGEKTGNLLNSLATDAKRQPGSSIKPLTAYSPSIELDLVDWSTIVPDEPIRLANGSLYPRNSYGFYYGDVTVQFGLEVSANAVSVHLINDYLTINRAFDFGKNRYSLDSLYDVYTHENGKTDTDKTLSSMATGGTLIGVTVQEITEAYSVFGNGGKLYDSYSYYYVENIDGEVILDNRDPLYEQAISESTAGVMNKMLQAVVQNKSGAANAARNAKIGTWEIYGKTGTTNDFKDRWFVAGNPYCVAGIWCGYEFVPKYIAGNHHSVYIWKRIMQEYLNGKEQITFDTPDSIVQRWYCTKTGQFATTLCPNAKQGWYKLNSGMTSCREHRGTVIRAGEKWVYKPPVVVKPVVPSTPTEPTTSTQDNTTSSQGG
ncbi:MAG: transglycosylase domain-containing protein, partial [Clostridia bacterium]|nr:transglycosylase domain-containing protein [Clostridia bacterium]